MSNGAVRAGRPSIGAGRRRSVPQHLYSPVDTACQPRLQSNSRAARARAAAGTRKAGTESLCRAPCRRTWRCHRAGVGRPPHRRLSGPGGHSGDGRLRATRARAVLRSGPVVSCAPTPGPRSEVCSPRPSCYRSGTPRSTRGTPCARSTGAGPAGDRPGGGDRAAGRALHESATRRSRSGSSREYRARVAGHRGRGLRGAVARRAAGASRPLR